MTTPNWFALAADLARQADASQAHARWAANQDFILTELADLRAALDRAHCSIYLLEYAVEYGFVSTTPEGRDAEYNAWMNPLRD